MCTRKNKDKQQKVLQDIENPVEDTVQKSKKNDEDNKKDSPPSLSRLLQSMKHEKGMIFVGFLFLLANESTTQVIPLLVAKAYDAIIVGISSSSSALENDEDSTTAGNRMKLVNYYMGLSMIIFCVGALCTFFRFSIFNVAAERIVARLRNDLYSSIIIQDIAFFDEHKSGELISRLSSDTSLVQNVVSMSIPETITNVVKAIVSIVLIFTISPKLAAMSVGTILVIIVASVPLGLKLGALSKAYQDALGNAQTCSTEALGSMRTVQSFTAEEKETLRYSKYIGDPDKFPFWWPTKTKTEKWVDSTYSVGFWKSIVSSGFFSIIFGGIFGLLYVVQWYGFYLVNSGEITVGDITAFYAYVFNIGLGLGIASSHVAKILECLGASGRIFHLLDCHPTIHEGGKNSKKQNNNKKEEKSKTPPLKPSTLDASIDFSKVEFAYPSRPDIKVLNDYTLNIPSGSTTALVGSSGSGKSTIVSLLQRFYDVNSGSISVDGNDIRDLDLKWLRSQIGFVQQEPQLFGVSVRENLLYGIPDDGSRNISQEEIEQACIDANCHDFISSWPDGYDTLVGERGVQLSGGQKQRISIARALITNCRILLLDEATSALDAESEHLVQCAIDKAVVGRTVIIVAHRLSTIQRATQIVVMADHKIVDVGTHEYLLENCSKYQELIKRQNMALTSSIQIMHELDTDSS